MTLYVLIHNNSTYFDSCPEHLTPLVKTLCCLIIYVFLCYKKSLVFKKKIF